MSRQGLWWSGAAFSLLVALGWCGWYAVDAHRVEHPPRRAAPDAVVRTTRGTSYRLLSWRESATVSDPLLGEDVAPGERMTWVMTEVEFVRGADPRERLSCTLPLADDTAITLQPRRAGTVECATTEDRRLVFRQAHAVPTALLPRLRGVLVDPDPTPGSTETQLLLPRPPA